MVRELIRSRDAKLHLNLAWLRLAEGDPSGAACLFSRGMELDGQNPEIMLDLKQAAKALREYSSPDCSRFREAYDTLHKGIHDAETHRRTTEHHPDQHR